MYISLSLYIYIYIYAAYAYASMHLCIICMILYMHQVFQHLGLESGYDYLTFGPYIHIYIYIYIYIYQAILAQSTTITTPTAEKGWAKRACSPERQPIPPPSRDPQRPCSSLHRRAGLLHPLDHARSSPSSTPAPAPRVTNLLLYHFYYSTLTVLTIPLSAVNHYGQWLPKAGAGPQRGTPRSRSPLLEFLPRDLPK